MKTSYGVTWCETDREPATGMLELGPHALVLMTDGQISRELRYEALVALTLLVVPDGSPRLVLTSYDGTDFELVSSVDAWIVRDLLDKLVGHALGSDIPLRFLVSYQAGRPGLGLS